MFSKELETKLSYDPAILHLDIYSMFYYRDICTSIFTAAVVTISSKWNQFGFSSTDECMRKMWYLHTMKYYSAIKKI